MCEVNLRQKRILFRATFVTKKTKILMKMLLLNTLPYIRYDKVLFHFNVETHKRKNNFTFSINNNRWQVSYCTEN